MLLFNMRKKSCSSSRCFSPLRLLFYYLYISVLKEYFSRKSTVSGLCKRYAISVSTLYSWKRLYIEHKALCLGVIQNMSIRSSDFLVRIFNLPGFSDLTKGFFSQVSLFFYAREFTYDNFSSAVILIAILFVLIT